MFSLLVFRIVLGLLMAAHGSQKLLGWFGGGGIEGTSQWMQHGLGFRQPRLMALMAGGGELFGGLLLALGLLTPLAAFLIITTMVVAVATVHIKSGWQNANGGFEYNALIAIGAALVVGVGPGRYSFDWQMDMVGSPWNGTRAMLVVLAAGALAALGTIALFRGAAPVPTSGEDTGGSEAVAEDIAPVEAGPGEADGYVAPSGDELRAANDSHDERDSVSPTQLRDELAVAATSPLIEPAREHVR
jgi:putative oxidoreductase